MESSKNYRQQLIEKIVDFKNSTEYEILNNDNMESDCQSSNKNNCSSSDPVLIWMSTMQRSIRNKAIPSKNK